MGAYLVRYTVEVEALNGKPMTFYHNALTQQQNLHEQAGGEVSPALVIHDEARALYLAKCYADTAERVDVLEFAVAWSTDKTFKGVK